LGRIHVLDDALINRIAAGEVVERPSSVVKELVENSLDAGARSIEVELRAGGRQRIRVTDDGRGMDRDDAVLAVERHATSKIARAGQLESIETLGFRGEALATIAAVSRFTLRAAEVDGEGTEVEVHGGRIQAVRQVGLPKGCTVQVDRLFYNTPARRKFLRAEQTELSHCLRWLTRYALAHPEHRFHVSHGQRRLLDLPPTSDLRERVAQIYGANFAGKLLPFEGELGGVSVSGLAGRPVEGLPRRDAQHFLVNGRAVQDRVLGHAVSAAYGNTMPAGRHPAIILWLELAPELVDVNVHPQKTEIRLRQPSAVHDLVRDSVSNALGRRGVVPSLSDLRPRAIPQGSGEVREATLNYLDAHRSAPSRPEPSPTSPRDREWQPMIATRPAAEVGSVEADARPQVVMEHAAGERRAAPLAQFRDSYIVAEDASGLVLVDQHAAHERVLFERYLEEAEQNRVDVQRLLFPVTIELAAHERAALETELDEFARLGFVVEPFGGNAVRLDGVPAIATDLDPESLFRELLGEAGRANAAATDVAQVRLKLVTTAACKAAIKINHPLTTSGMQRLLDDLYGTTNPTTCPHGRPIVFRLSLDEIERAFRRR
jgi:DNA mismatch repair protein MutL